MSVSLCVHVVSVTSGREIVAERLELELERVKAPHASCSYTLKVAWLNYSEHQLG